MSGISGNLCVAAYAGQVYAPVASNDIVIYSSYSNSSLYFGALGANNYLQVTPNFSYTSNFITSNLILGGSITIPGGVPNVGTALLFTSNLAYAASNPTFYTSNLAYAASNPVFITSNSVFTAFTFNGTNVSVAGTIASTTVTSLSNAVLYLQTNSGGVTGTVSNAINYTSNSVWTAFGFNGTNVGVGTKNPSAKLHVSGGGSAGSALYFENTTQSLNNKAWGMGLTGSTFNGYTMNDVYGSNVNWVQVARSGTSVSSVMFPNGFVQIGNNPVVNKQLVLYDLNPGEAVSTATTFYGLGINNQVLRYQVPNANSHVFYNGSTNIATIQSTGLVVNGTITATNITALSNTAYYTSNSAYAASNPTFFTSNLAYAASNPTFFTSNLAYASSNPTFFTSNLAFAASNPIFFTSNLAYAASNPTFFTSNLAYAASNPTFYTSNLAYAASNPTFFTSNLAYASSNPTFFTSNLAYGASNSIFFTSNLAYAASNPTFFTSNLAYAASNPTFFTSNLAYASSNPTFFTSNLAYAASNPTFFTSNSVWTAFGFSGTNVGVGTKNPSAKLHVSGTGGSTSAIYIEDTSQSLNNKAWGMGSFGSTFYGYTMNDVYGGSVNWVQVARSSTSVSSVMFPNGYVQIGNNPAANKVLVLYDSGPNDNVSTASNFYGFGMNSSTLRYQVPNNTNMHRFYLGSTNTATIQSTGLVVNGTITASNITALSNTAYYTSNLAYAASNPTFFTSNLAYAASNPTFFTSNLAYAASNPTFFTSNLAYAASNPTFFTSNLAYGASNRIFFTSNLAYAASNPTFFTSNLAYAASNPTFFTSNLAFAASNPTFFTSNLAYAASNPTFFTSNLAYAASNPTFFTSNLTYAASNPTFYTSNLAYAASNPTFYTSNLAYAASNPTFFTSNLAYAASNPTFFTSNLAYAASNPTFFTSNLAYAASNPVFITSNSVFRAFAFNGTDVSVAGTIASTTVTSLSNAVLYLQTNPFGGGGGITSTNSNAINFTSNAVWNTMSFENSNVTIKNNAIVGRNVTQFLATVYTSGANSLLIGNASAAGAFGAISCTAATSALTIEAFNQANNTKMPIGLQAWGGNVGIGKLNPGAKLHVSGGGGAGSAIYIEDTTQTFNNKAWGMGLFGSTFYGYTMNDVYGGHVNWVQVARSSTSVSSVMFPNGFVQIGNNPVVNKQLVLWDGNASEAVAGAVSFYGFGVNPSTLRYQSMASGTHKFYSGSAYLGGFIPSGSTENTFETNKARFYSSGGSAFLQIGGLNGNNVDLNFNPNGSAGPLTLRNNGTGGLNVNTNGIFVNGALSKSSGSFEIQHPTLSNKILIHSFIEGPRCDLIYRGKVCLSNGTGSVNLDKDCTQNSNCSMTEGTFVALCVNPQMFLQNMTGYSTLKGTIDANTMTITSQDSNCSDMVSWMVVAERKDDFIKTWDRTDENGYLITEHAPTEQYV